MFSKPLDSYARLRRAHTPVAISRRLSERPQVSYLRDWVHGGIDGAVTTFAILAGVAGAALAPHVMLIVGVANLLADGFALAAGNYTATRSEHDDYARLKHQEAEEIAIVPDGEKEEIRQIYQAKGFEGADLERVVEVITADRERWIEAMLQEEHGLAVSLRIPVLSAGSTFIAFVICGAVPLVPLLFGWTFDLMLSGVLTGLVFFGIGAARSRWSTSGWMRTALETLAIGLTAAGIAYAVGRGLRVMLTG